MKRRLLVAAVAALVATDALDVSVTESTGGHSDASLYTDTTGALGFIARCTA